jgi:hypothetical protein
MYENEISKRNDLNIVTREMPATTSLLKYICSLYYKLTLCYMRK